MEVVNKYKVHALDSCNRGSPPCSNSTFYETKQDAVRRAKQCIKKGCEAIVIYEAITVVTPTCPEVEFHDVE